jgi:hypothetical protein
MTGMQLSMGFAKQKKNQGGCPLLPQNNFLQKKRKNNKNSKYLNGDYLLHYISLMTKISRQGGDFNS